MSPMPRRHSGPRAFAVQSPALGLSSYPRLIEHASPGRLDHSFVSRRLEHSFVFREARTRTPKVDRSTRKRKRRFLFLFGTALGLSFLLGQRYYHRYYDRTGRGGNRIGWRCGGTVWKLLGGRNGRPTGCARCIMLRRSEGPVRAIPYRSACAQLCHARVHSRSDLCDIRSGVTRARE
ncbi:hypothetical protein BV22DRAFT_323968 [Leucogyrophana mollusca]|uniref:Uncharacterized protein n=1 Tax=Leucogyrophana mollusca TaxID=85980 RepID=A0ACB8BNJ7_9AGAM|nr:hypothetical protein BV22DRAFT_323968 [Leucogyrophana mollusca]